jgi:CHAD domain-containing protein
LHRKQLAQTLQTYGSRRAQRLILHLQSWLASQPKTGGQSISKQRRSTLKANMKRPGKLGALTPSRSVTEVHAMRIMVKKIRYTVEIFPGAEDEETRLALQSLEKAQDALGDLNDACKALNLISVAVNENLSPDFILLFGNGSTNASLLAFVKHSHITKSAHGEQKITSNRTICSLRLSGIVSPFDHPEDRLDGFRFYLNDPTNFSILSQPFINTSWG